MSLSSADSVLRFTSSDRFIIHLRKKMKSEPKISTLDLLENLLFELKDAKGTPAQTLSAELQERIEALLSRYMKEREEENAHTKERNSRIQALSQTEMAHKAELEELRIRLSLMQSNADEQHKRELSLVAKAQKVYRSRLGEVLNDVDRLKMLAALLHRRIPLPICSLPSPCRASRRWQGLRARPDAQGEKRVALPPYQLLHQER